MVAVSAPERRGGTNEMAVSVTAVRTNRSAGRALHRRRAAAMTMPTTEKKPVTTANPDNGIVSPPSGTSKSTPTAWASAAARVVASIAASVAMKPVPASPRSGWVWLAWPDAGPATTPALFMFLHVVPPSFGNWRAGCVARHLTVLARVTFSPVDRSTAVGSAAEGGMRAADVHLPARSTRSTHSRAGRFLGGEGPGTTLWTG